MNTEFLVELESSANTTSTWILENVNEVKEAYVEPLNLVESFYGDEPNTGKYIQAKPNDATAGGIYQFKFKVGNTTLENLPQLKFAYKNDADPNEDELKVKVNLIAGKDESLKDELVFFRDDNDDIELKELGEKFELDLKVNEDAIHTITLFGAFPEKPTTGNSWYLDNTEEELNGLVELKNVYSYVDEPYYSIDVMYTVYRFFIKMSKFTTKDELPVLRFSYKSTPESTSVESSVIVNLRRKEETVLTFKQEEDLKKKINAYRNETFVVELETNPSTGYKWFLDNVDDVKSSDSIEPLNLIENDELPYLAKSSNSPGVGGGMGIYRLRFQFKEGAKEGKLQPTLMFSQARSKSAEAIAKAELDVSLKIERSEKDLKDTSLPVIIFDKSTAEGDNVVYVESNTILQFTEESNPSTGCSWVIMNKDEIDRSNYIDYIGSRYTSLCPTGEPRIAGCGGEETFQYRIWEVKEGDELPEIHMVYGHAWAIEKEGYETLNITLKVKKSEKKEEKEIKKENNENEKDLKGTNLPVIIFDAKKEAEDNVVYVESNSILQFTEESNPSTGCSWVILNKDEITNSDFIDYIGSSHESYCKSEKPEEIIDGCGGEETFQFRIWDVKEGDELPEIHMVYGHAWAIEKEAYETLNLTLKVKKEKETPKLIRTCNSESLGYSCCKKHHDQDSIFTDSNGQWSIEDGQLCGIPTCTYTGDYPVCEKTTKVVYTDTEKWGVEHGQWCVLCL